MSNPDIWTWASDKVEALAQQVSQATFGFFEHGLYIFGLALMLCRFTSRGRFTSNTLNWFWLMIAFVLGPKLPILIPESATVKVLLLVAGATVIVLAPARLSVYLSRNEPQRQRIQFFLFALLLIVFAVDQFTRRSP